MSYLHNLSKDAKIVSSARFNQSRFLQRKIWWSLFSISLLSFELIIIAVLERTYEIKILKPFIFLDFKMETWLFSVLSSIIILILSIAISSAKLEVQYEKLMDSAMNINAVHRRIDAFIESEGKDRDADYFLGKYLSALSSNLINHNELDYKIAKGIINKKTGFCHKCNVYFIQRLGLVYYYLISVISVCSIYSSLTSITFALG